MATNLDHFLGSNCVHHRMEEGEEEAPFKRLFGNAIKVLPGSSAGATASARSSSKASRHRLLLISGHEQHHRVDAAHEKMRVTEVPLAWGS